MIPGDWRTTRNKIYAGEKARTVDEVCFTIQKHIMEFMIDGKSNFYDSHSYIEMGTA